MKNISLENYTIKDIEELIVSKEKYFRFAINSEEGIVFSMDGIITEYNRKMAEMFGYTEEEFKGKQFKDIIHQDDLKEVNYNISNNKEAQYQIKGIKKDNTIIHLEVLGKLVQCNNSTIRLSIFRDITSKLQIKNKLLENEHLLQKIFDHAPVIMLLLNENFEIEKINQNGLNISGLQEKEVIGKQVGEVFHCYTCSKNDGNCGKTEECKNCSIRNSLIRTFETGQDIIKEETDIFIIQSKIITHHTVLISTSLMEFSSSKYLLVTFDDISERKRMEKELTLAKNRAEESDKLKLAFLANMSHEIRTPMNGIVGFAEMLATKDFPQEKRERFAKIISNSSRQLLAIVNDILDVSKIETGQIEIVETEQSLFKILEHLKTFYTPLAEEKKINFIIKNLLPETADNIFCDKTRLLQIFNNLIGNAFKFTEHGYVELECRKNKALLEFSVKDTGIGIPLNMQSKIFERFRQADIGINRKYGGTGLGLTICKSLIEKMGGSIRVSSIEGMGATFTFTLPFKPVYHKPETNVKPESKYISKWNKSTVLIAEDEDMNMLYLEEILYNTNTEILKATNGKEAVELIEKNDTISLVLMDIKMPIMNGIEALKHIKKIRPELPVIAQTAHAMPEDKLNALNNGFNEYISKPIDINNLIRLMSKYLT
ncbi:MAG: ATP-binding protein [Bacteroidales bacterium]